MEYSVFITSPLALGTLVRRNIDQVNYHLHSMATNLTHPKLKREFLKRSLKFRGANPYVLEPTLKWSKTRWVTHFKKFIRMQLGLVKLSIFLVTTITLILFCLSVIVLVEVIVVVNIWLLCVNATSMETCRVL